MQRSKTLPDIRRSAMLFLAQTADRRLVPWIGLTMTFLLLASPVHANITLNARHALASSSPVAGGPFDNHLEVVTDFEPASLHVSSAASGPDGSAPSRPVRRDLFFQRKGLTRDCFLNSIATAASRLGVCSKAPDQLPAGKKTYLGGAL